MRLIAGITCFLLSTAPLISFGADAEKNYQDIFGAKDKKVGISPSTEDDAAFAGQLVESAEMMSDDKPFQIYVLEKAIDFGVRHQEGIKFANKALGYLEILIAEKKQHLANLRIQIAEGQYKLCKGKERAEGAVKFVEVLLEMGDRELDEGNTDEAGKKYNKALTISATADPETRKTVVERIKKLNSAIAADRRYEQLLTAHKKAPDNVKAREDLIRLLLVEKDDPAEAVKYLNDSVDADLRRNVPLAAKRIEDVKDPECLKLGEWYHKQLYSRANPSCKPDMLDRAMNYYERFMEIHKTKDTGRIKAQLAMDAIVREMGKYHRTNVPKGAVLVLNFEKNTVGNSRGVPFFRDSSGKNNHGIAKNVHFGQGVAGSAALFKGDGVITVRNNRSLQLNGSVTIMFWLRPKSLGVRRNPFAKNYGCEGTMTLEIAGSINFFYGTAKTSEKYTSINMGKMMVPGKWAHVALVRDMERRALRWIKNGVQVTEKKCPYTTLGVSKDDVTIGDGYTSPFIGEIDEFAIFNRALTLQEVQKLYMLGTKGKPLIGPGR